VQAGLLVVRVAKGSPADFAGLRAPDSATGKGPSWGDVVVRVAGRSVNSEADLLQALDAHVSGEVLVVDVLRSLTSVAGPDEGGPVDRREVSLRLRL
jgi:S1-C subfamily serine protease